MVEVAPDHVARRAALGQKMGGREKVRVMVEVLRRWEKEHFICRARGGKRGAAHQTMWCTQADEEGDELAPRFEARVRKMAAPPAPTCAQGGKCWFGFVRCMRREEGEGECRWSRLACEVVCALVSAGNVGRRQEIESWTESRGFWEGKEAAERQWERFVGFLGRAV